MPTFSLYDGLTKVIEPLGKAFTFIFNALRGLLSKINAEPLFFIPLALALMLGIAFWAAWTVMEASQYADGSPYANPNRQFGRLANPNNQYDTKMPLWTKVGRYAIWKNKQHRIEEEKQKTEELNRNLAEKFFHNNPNAYRINIDGKTFWRDGWENHRWDKDGRMRHTIRFKREGTTYVPIGESHSVTEYDDPD